MKQLTLTAIILSLFTTLSFSQTKIGAFGEVIVEQAAPIPEINTISAENITFGASNQAEKDKGKKTTKAQVESEYRYMSYKIQVTSTPDPLDLNHHIFTLYQDISFNQTRNDGFTYYQGDYSDEKQAQAVLIKIQRIFPQATIVKERRYLKTES